MSLGFSAQAEEQNNANNAIELIKTYSTVTDFAKFLGWSTSLPFATAM